MLLLYHYNKLPFSAKNYGREFFTFIFWTPIKWLSWLLINSHYYVLKKQVIFGRFTFSPHVKTQDVSMFGERECLGNSWSFLVGRPKKTASENAEAWPEEDVKTKRLPCWKFQFFFLSLQFTSIAVKKKKKTFVGPSSSESLMNDVSKITAGIPLLHKRKKLCGGLERGKRSSRRRGERELASAF